MPTSNSCAAGAVASRRRLSAAGLATAALLGACAPGQDSRLAQQQAAERPTTEVQPFDTAMTSLTTALFARAQLDPSEKRALVVDPPVDRLTVRQAAVTRDVERHILNVVSKRVPYMQSSPMAETTWEGRPIVLLSCMTPVAGPGAMATDPIAPPKVYRIWASLSDTRTGRVVSSETVWVPAKDVDATPTKFYRDSPVWVMDDSMRAYLKVCGGKPGDAMDPAYLNGMSASIATNQAIADYEAGRYPEALAGYTKASQLPGGDRIRVWNGLYLTNVALGHREAAEEAFGRMVDAGLAQGKLAVKFVFQPASTRFWPDRAVSGEYPAWLRQIADRSAAQRTCMLLTGHTSPTGTREANEVLSTRRAQFVRGQLLRRDPVLGTRTEALGRGSSEPMVGTGEDNASDLLDRRVEFEPRPCDTLQVNRGGWVGHL